MTIITPLRKVPSHYPTISLSARHTIIIILIIVVITIATRHHRRHLVSSCHHYLAVFPRQHCSNITTATTIAATTNHQ
jgi:hypothetical protein